MRLKPYTDNVRATRWKEPWPLIGTEVLCQACTAHFQTEVCEKKTPLLLFNPFLWVFSHTLLTAARHSMLDFSPSSATLHSQPSFPFLGPLPLPGPLNAPVPSTLWAE